MENQHKHIKGYRDLSKTEIDLMNEIKTKGEELRVLIDRIKDTEGTDKRWVAIATTEFQLGLMSLTRSVAKPESF